MLGMHRLLVVASAGLAFNSAVGGWAVITIENPPDHLEAGTSYRLEYTVRQHGVTPLGGLQATILIQPAGSGATESSTFPAVGGATTGRYVATLRVPETDRMALTVQSGFSGAGFGDLTLIPIPVVRRGEAGPSLTLQERGHRLFVAKGCGRCHINGDVPEFALMNRVLTNIGPELTGRRLEEAYVRQRLTNPSSLPRIGDAPVRMPDLGLAPAEVDALVALLGGPTERASE
jgi:hypothetical protein